MKSVYRRRASVQQRRALRGLQRHATAEAQDESELAHVTTAARASVSGPDALHPADVLALQHTVGNQAVQRLLAGEQPGEAQAGSIQRRPLTAAERAENLTSPRFAGDARLEEAFDNAPPMAIGEHSDAVAKVQQALIDAGYPMPITVKKTGSPDGIFGSETRAMVRQFQRDHGLNPDGIVGRNTLGELDRIYGSAPAKDPEIEASEEALGEHMVEGVHKINDPGSFSGDSGVWYAHVLEPLHNQDPDAYPWQAQWRGGYADPKYFEMVGWMDWRLKPHVSASEGIKKWLEGLTVAECQTALIAIELDSVRAAIGDEKFDELFGSTRSNLADESRLHIRPGGGSSLQNFLVATDARKAGDAGKFGDRPAKEGEWYYFYNHPQYLLKHPGGAFQGENAVYMGKNAAGEQLWAGMGVSDTTEEGMLKEMQGAYNLERDDIDYEYIVRYHTTKPIPIPPGKPNWQALYNANLDKVKPEYIPGNNVFPDQLNDWKEILDAPEYEIDGDKRKGGFVVEAGKKLDVDLVQALRGS